MIDRKDGKIIITCECGRELKTTDNLKKGDDPRRLHCECLETIEIWITE